MHRSRTSNVVYFDFQISAHQSQGGISRYFESLESEISLSGIACSGSWNLPLRRRLASLPARAKLARCMDTAMLYSTRPGLVHHTYYDYLHKGPIPTVTTIHDMIPEVLWHASRSMRLIDKKKQHIERCDAIICVSEFTRRQLLELYPRAEDKVRVIYEASSEEFSAEGDTSNLVTPYYLYVGKRDGYKKFERLLEAHQRLKDDVPLIVAVGGEPARPMPGVVFTGPVSDSRLAALYRGAIALVVTSEAEGFGLPVLEAMACGCVVVSSGGGSLQEIGGDAAIYFGDSVGDLTDTLKGLLGASREYIEAYRRRGLSRSAEFSWRRTAAETVNLYGDLI